MSLIKSGFPNFRHELPPALREYYQFCDHLYTVDGVILYKDRIVVPPLLHQHVLSVLHLAHQGVISMIARTETTLLARHHPHYYTLTNKLLPLQPHGTFPAQRTTLSFATSIPLPVRMH